MLSFALILVCIVAGMLITRRNILPKGSYKSLNIWLLYVALPALSLRFVPEIEWNLSALIPSVSPPIVWLGAVLFVNIYAKFVKLNKETKTALFITSGLGNSAFLGFPLIAAYFGEENIRNAIVYDQITFIMFSVVVVPIVLKISANNTATTTKSNVALLVKKLFLFPPFLATLFALIVSPFFDYSAINPLLDKLLATLSPLALFSIGLQIRFDNWKTETKNIIAGLSYKLLVAPALVLILILLAKETTLLANVTLMEASMPAHITGSLLASQYNLNPRLCNLMVGLGIVAGFITTAIWYWIGINVI